MTKLKRRLRQDCLRSSKKQKGKKKKQQDYLLSNSKRQLRKWKRLVDRKKLKSRRR